MLRVLRSCPSARRFFTTAPLPTIPPFAPSPPRFSSVCSIKDYAPFEKIQIPGRSYDRIKFDGYVVGKRNTPGIVVLQDWLGVDHYAKDHALSISQLGSGFRVLIPDLYRGNSEQLFNGYDIESAKSGLFSSVDWLKANGSKKVGVIGFSKGAALAIECSFATPPIDAVVVFYGTPLCFFGVPQCPVQAHFGELDDCVGFSDLNTVKKLKRTLKHSRFPHKVHIYPGNRHSFMNRSREGIKRQNSMGLPDADEDAVQLAWSRLWTWMTTYLSS